MYLSCIFSNSAAPVAPPGRAEIKITELVIKFHSCWFFDSYTLIKHGDNFKAHIFLHRQLYPTEHQGDMGDLLDH